MAHIAIVTGLLKGRMHSSFEMASRLLAEGHSITYLCQPSTKSKIEANGFKCVPVPEITFNYKDPRRKDYESSWVKKMIFHWKYRNSHYSEGKKILKLSAHTAVLRKVNPDLILVDIEIHDLIFTAIALGIPIKLYTSWFSDKISLKSPSIRTSVIPGRGISGSRVGVFFSWWLMRSKIYGRVFVNRLTFENYRRWFFKKYAKEIGFNTSGMLVNTLPPLYSFTNIPIISMTMSEMEFPHNLAKNVIYVGPMVYEKRTDQIGFEAVGQQLNEIFDLKKKTNKKLVYCSVGSMVHNRQNFLRNVIEAIAIEKDWLLILSIGPNMEVSEFDSIPENVYLFNWVPQLEVIEQADCCITHGAMNSIHECLHFKKPMLIYSGGRIDQDGNTARMDYHALALKGESDLESPELIQERIYQVLEMDLYKNRVGHFYNLYRSYRDRSLGPLLLEKK